MITYDGEAEPSELRAPGNGDIEFSDILGSIRLFPKREID